MILVTVSPQEVDRQPLPVVSFGWDASCDNNLQPTAVKPMESWNWTPWIGVLFFTPLLLLWWVRTRQQRRLRAFLKSESLVTGMPLPPGPVQLQGTCQLQQPLISPVSNTSCAGFTLEVEVFVNDTDGGDFWDLAYIDVLAPFSLHLKRGPVTVSGRSHFLWLVGDPVAKREMRLGDLPVELGRRIIAAARERLSEDRPDIIPNADQQIHLIERVLKPGSDVLIVGESRHLPQASDDTKTEPRIGPRERLPLLVINRTRRQIQTHLRRTIRQPLLLGLLDDLVR